MRNKQVEFNPYIYTLSKLYRFGYEISVFNTKHPVIIPRASLFVVTPSHVASWKIECQNFSYVYRSRKHWECKYYFINKSIVFQITLDGALCFAICKSSKETIRLKLENTSIRIFVVVYIYMYISNLIIKATCCFPVNCIFLKVVENSYRMPTTTIEFWYCKHRFKKTNFRRLFMLIPNQSIVRIRILYFLFSFYFRNV